MSDLARGHAAWVESVAWLPDVAEPLLSYLRTSLWERGDRTGPYEMSGGRFDGGFILHVPAKGDEGSCHAIVILTRNGIHTRPHAVGGSTIEVTEENLTPKRLVDIARAHASAEVFRTRRPKSKPNPKSKKKRKRK